MTPWTAGLDDDDRRLLLDLADLAIRRGLDVAPPPAASSDGPLSAAVRQQLGVFVTVTVAGGLNGCIGTITPTEALAEAVPRLAWEAAFDDPRLPPLQRRDYARLGIEISVLSPAEPLEVASEADLVARLRPGVDGLILADGALRATFLPAVWDKLGDPHQFLAHLKAKAGIPPGTWPPGIQVARYTAEEWGTG